MIIDNLSTCTVEQTFYEKKFKNGSNHHLRPHSEVPQFFFYQLPPPSPRLLILSFSLSKSQFTAPFSLIAALYHFLEKEWKEARLQL